MSPAAKHTPGPWFERDGAVCAEGRGQLALVVTTNGDHEEAAGNAALIVAAPKLLEAAMEVIRSREENDYGADGHQGLEMLKAAIARAVKP